MADEEAAKTGVAPTGETPPAKPMSANDLMTMANNYHVPMSQGTLQSIVGDTPEVSPEKATAFEGYVKTTAAGLYPTLAPQINAGIPTSFLLDPYRRSVNKCSVTTTSPTSRPTRMIGRRCKAAHQTRRPGAPLR